MTPVDDHVRASQTNGAIIRIAFESENIEAKYRRGERRGVWECWYRGISSTVDSQSMFSPSMSSGLNPQRDSSVSSVPHVRYGTSRPILAVVVE